MTKRFEVTILRRFILYGSDEETVKTRAGELVKRFAKHGADVSLGEMKELPAIEDEARGPIFEDWSKARPGP